MSSARLTAHHPETPQARVHQVLRTLIYRIGVRETARLLDCDEDTVRNRLATGNLNAFGGDSLIRLKKRERDEFDTRELHDAETDAIYGAPQVMVLDLSSALLREAGEDAGVITEATAILQDGQVDASDLPRLEKLETKLQERAEHSQELLNGVRAKLTHLKRGGR